ncbi:ABC transporter substrate-binding protein [Candidatus Electronema sp. TJ]|uniref:ABC transporter substrate-binding protein n=1 Tax=Candidatus Electronema sp. TJ TaxID=3401573 RepID=UPI003AA93439
MRRQGLVHAVFLLFMLCGTAARAVQYVDAPPLAKVVSAAAEDIKLGGPVRVPLITWGGDEATILANGNAAQTAPDSIFGKKGLKLQLVREDDFKKQIESYLRGETPYLRGTMGMVSMASEVLGRDPRTAPVVIYQLTWSNGGDCLVVKPGIKTAKDLKGKTVALQAYGPHVDYLAKVLADAGLAMSDVSIKWVKDLTGTAETPAEAFREDGIDAAMMIIPDGMALTSGGTAGTGAEGSVKGAEILLSTKTANRIIADVYAVRSDYFKSHHAEVEKFVNGLMQGEEQLADLLKNKSARMKEYTETVKASAQMLFDSPAATADAESLRVDCEFVGFVGNVKFFTDPNYPRNFLNLRDQTQNAFVKLGLLGRKSPLAAAEFSYDALKNGLRNTAGVEAPKFDSAKVAGVIQRKQQQDRLAEGELFSFEVFFQPNQNQFSADLYADAFNKVIELASTYGGAVITIEGHSDPMGWLQAKKRQETEMALNQIKQAAKNLSLSRANAVRESIMTFAATKGVTLDESQFAVIGHGITKPKSSLCGDDPCPPKTEQAWRDNMRVEFRIIQLEAEASVFKPL